jgi:alpha-ribazole phosphatase
VSGGELRPWRLVLNVRLYLIRHLQPIVAPGVCYGRSDLAVDPQLLADALPALRRRLPVDAPVYTSPLQRCASLASALTAQVKVDARLAELDFGAWEMRSWDDIDRAEIDAWAADVATCRPGGGESVLEMAHRISDFQSDLLRAPEPEAVVVCHAGAIRLLAARVRGLAPAAMAQEAAARPHAIAYGEVILLESV